MSVRRMVAALAVALCFGGVMAALVNPGQEIGAAYAMVAALLAALAIAGLVVLAAVVVRRGARPSRRVVAVALVAGGLVTFPVHARFYQDASFAAEGGSVGRCSGIVPLPQVVYHGFADETLGELFYFASCDD